MKKTIVVEFPDGFDFPEKADILFMSEKCSKCPVFVEDDRFGFCFVTDRSDAPCPFYGRADAATLTRDK